MRQLEARTIDGHVYLAAIDVTSALRERAGIYADDSDELTTHGAIAAELMQMADGIDVATIVYASDDGAGS